MKLCGLGAVEEVGVFLPDIEQTDPVGCLDPVEAAVSHHADRVAALESVDHGCPHAAAGGFAADEKRVALPRTKVEIERRAVEAAGSTFSMTRSPSSGALGHDSRRFDSGIAIGTIVPRV